jgi:predicted nucleic acid-binding protein
VEYLADPVAIIKFLRKRRIGARALRILREADLGQHRIHVSAMTLMEVLYLSQRRHIDLPLGELVDRIAASPNYVTVPIGTEIIVGAEDIKDVPELHDRILAATAKWLRVPILTPDRVLMKSKHVRTIWK